LGAKCAIRPGILPSFPASFEEAFVERRQFLAGAAGLVGGALIPRFAFAKVPTPFTFDMSPPMDSREKFIEWGVAQRGEDPKFLGERFDRFGAMVRNEDIWDERHKRAFLLTPREKFVLPQNLGRAYEHAFLDIGFGVTISGPHIVGRMTSTIDPKQGEKVLEIGTGSGYQSAYLSHLTDQVYTIEIIKPLAERTRGIYDSLIADGYVEFKAIQSRNADGYYGWVEAAAAAPTPAASPAATPAAVASPTPAPSATPAAAASPSPAATPAAAAAPEPITFDKIIVTCGIDHVPPPLLQQLKPNGIMVIPVGPPGAQRVLKVVKNQAADGSITVARSDIYGGRIVPFVPFTKLEGDAIKGTHNN
jgi:protein-L-isoaspartate(D-aspartate) O-methyltransferase